ncbi:MAG: hypothetical protein ABIR62_10355 [Dokdonella sp.]|uniref:hypothetical protein n=1 Tax=Dokdonella sp. TaxID=2291710 RepID=UPI0032661FD2
MKSTMAILLAVACALSGPLAAKEKYREVVNANSEEQFSQISENVRKDMSAGGRYEFVEPAERSKVEKGLADMAAMFRQSGSVDKMTQGDKVALFNTQEVVNAILTKRDSDRVICENRAPVGSHIPKTSCYTYGQLQESRRGTKQVFDRLAAPQCTAGAGGCGGGPAPPRK